MCRTSRTRSSNRRWCGCRAPASFSRSTRPNLRFGGAPGIAGNHAARARIRRASRRRGTLISRSISRSRAFQVKRAIRRRMNRWQTWHVRLPVRWRAARADSLRQPLPALLFGIGGRATLAGQLVELRLAVVLRGSPLGLDQALLLQPVERRVERALLDFQYVVGELVQAHGDAVAVVRPGAEALQDEQVERALQQVDLSDSHIIGILSCILP